MEKRKVGQRIGRNRWIEMYSRVWDSHIRDGLSLRSTAVLLGVEVLNLRKQMNPERKDAFWAWVKENNPGSVNRDNEMTKLVQRRVAAIERLSEESLTAEKLRDRVHAAKMALEYDESLKKLLQDFGTIPREQQTPVSEPGQRDIIIQWRDQPKPPEK